MNRAQLKDHSQRILTLPLLLLGLSILGDLGCQGEANTGVEAPVDAGSPTDLGPPQATPDGVAAVDADTIDLGSTDSQSGRISYLPGALVIDRTTDFGFLVPAGVEILAPTQESGNVYDVIEADRGQKVGRLFFEIGPGLPGVATGTPAVNPFGAEYYLREVKRLDGVEWSAFFFKGDRIAFAAFAKRARLEQFVDGCRWTN
jgi:hypothetical protein